ncbi:MAG TPA: HNH endonuclease signature motif containing protein [Planctomycetaceae bacterium]|jgi:hypothetical protein|nr:HNH endonuclease signature motif containing protein [Planctomycetaceae bacterium]
MERDIWIFGYPDKTPVGFPSGADLVEYIREGIFSSESHRHRHTLKRTLKDGDVIVLSRGAKLYGHLEISGWETPNDNDREVFPKVGRVYIARRSALYETPVALSQIGNPNIHFGKQVDEHLFDQIKSLAGSMDHFPRIPALAETPIEQERVLREVRDRLGQSEFRNSLLRAYGNRSAVTDYDALESLEAAHIDPYSGPESNDPSNGLLLRSDIHALFDLNILAINPDTFEVTLSPGLLKSSYANLQGKPLRLPSNVADRPTREVLSTRWRAFSG